MTPRSLLLTKKIGMSIHFGHDTNASMSNNKFCNLIYIKIFRRWSTLCHLLELNNLQFNFLVELFAYVNSNPIYIFVRVRYTRIFKNTYKYPSPCALILEGYHARHPICMFEGHIRMCLQITEKIEKGLKCYI